MAKKAKAKTKKSSNKKPAKETKIPCSAVNYDVGYGKPPKEHQFPPGQSGNPNGPPIHRVNLWPLFCKYMSMTDEELEKLERNQLSQAQQSALKLVEDMKNGEYSGSQRLARHVFDRDEGKSLERIRLEPTDMLSDDECEEIREMLKSHAK